MVFQPSIPLSGLGGWNFLQSTYDRQLENFSKTVQVGRDVQYMNEKLSSPMSVDELLDDRRLLRTAMTAIGLEGEEWKRGFIDKVLQESADPDSNFLARLNNPGYDKFAELFTPDENGQVSVSTADALDLGTRYQTEAFTIAVGNIDNNMRLGLNYQTGLKDIVDNSSSEDAIAFKILGNVPLRSVLESALGLPSDIRQLDIDRQADILKGRVQSQYGIRDLAELAEPETIDRVIEQFHARESLNQGPAPGTRGSVALTLLSGIGSLGSQNLFLSLLR